MVAMPLSHLGELTRIGLALADHLGRPVDARDVTAFLEDLLFGKRAMLWGVTQGIVTPNEAALGMLDRLFHWLMGAVDSDRWSTAYGGVPWEEVTATAEAVFATTAGSAPLPASEIKVIPGCRLAIRRRPAMYIGRTDSPAALTTMLGQVLCCALDEIATGNCTSVTVTLHGDDSASVADNGPGLPVEIDTLTGISKAEAVMTVLHACRREKADRQVGDRYCTVGMAAVNALSEWCVLQVSRAGFLWEQRYLRGEPQGPIFKRGPVAGSGTRIRFKPDSTIFTWPAFRPSERGAPRGRPPRGLPLCHLRVAQRGRRRLIARVA